MIADRSSSFVDRVRSYYTEFAPNHSVPIHATAMKAAADGVIIIDDADGEFTVFFDPDIWQFADPTLWAEPSGTTRSPDLKNLGLGLLEGCGLTFGGSFENAFRYGQRNLVSATRQWYDSLQPIEFKPPWLA